MTDWKPCSVGDLCDSGLVELQTGPFGTQLHAHDYVVDGVPVVPTEAIRGRQIDRSVLPMISPAKAAELGRHKLKAGDILFARRGVQATGHIAYVRDDEMGFVCGTGAIRLRVAENNPSVSSEFLSHVFADPASIEWFKFHAIGATMPNLNEGIIRSFPLSLPSLDEQKAIAVFLSAFDDKIALNLRANEAMEALARAIFGDWFTDFGPVQAKIDGLTPYLASPLWALFPDRLDVQGRPEGWTVSKLGDEVSTLLGGTPSRDQPRFWGGDIPWINSGKANEFRVIEPSEYITNEGFESSATKKLPSRTTIIAITGATLGQVSLTEIETCANQSVVGVVASKSFPGEYLYFWVCENINTLLASQTGGAQQHINKNNVNELPLLCPPDRLMSSYVDLVRPIFDRISVGCFESQTLAATRDLLLPNLTSGAIVLSDAEKMAEAVL